MVTRALPKFSRKTFLRLVTGGVAAATLLRAGRAEENDGSAVMHTRVIPSSGQEIPVVGLGTWQAFDVGGNESELARLGQVVDELFTAGGRVIDSSPMYGRAEQVVGHLLADREPNTPPFVATKVWTQGREQGVRQMNCSAKRLGRQQIDLMQVHNLLDWREHLDTLRGWKTDGTIRYLGVTHYTSRALDDVTELIESEALDFVQIAYSAGERLAERRLLPAAAVHGTAVIVNRPFEGGSIFRTVRNRPLPDWAKEFDCQSWGQLFLKFILGHPAVTCIIPGTGNPGHMRDNAGAGKGVLLNDSDRERIARYLETL